MTKIRLQGYAPDADKTVPGVITTCSAAVPSTRGMEGAPGPVTSALAALAAECRGAAVLRKTDDTTRMFAGTSTKLYEAGSTTWTDQTRLVGGNYTLAAGYRWSFAVFGSNCLAIQKGDKLQVSASTTFADVSAAPKASIVETVGQFVFVFDYDDGTDTPDGWYCCASGDYTDWTTSVATECAKGRLISSPGAIRAGKRFGDQIVVYKNRSMFLGTYQGAPEIWRFDEIPVQVGAASNEAVVDVSTENYPRHIFMGWDDFYSFDGSRPVPIGVGWVKELVFGDWNPLFSRSVCGVHDPQNSRVYFYYPNSAGTLNQCVVYNYLTKKWGRDDRTIQCAFSYISPGVTYDGLGALYSTYSDLPNLSYDSSFFSTGVPVPGIFNSSNVLQTLNGSSTTSSITTGDMGDDEKFTLISRVRPIFLTKPTSSTMTNYYKQNIGDSLTTGGTSTFTDGKYDRLRSARWHRLQFDFVGDWEMADMSIYASDEGMR